VVDLRCDVAQGCLSGRPGTAAEVTDVLRARTAATTDLV
jgi:EAL domain-containing protein (putative c-di-GMP-specific phosphodiesterase class I)